MLITCSKVKWKNAVLFNFFFQITMSQKGIYKNGGSIVNSLEPWSSGGSKNSKLRCNRPKSFGLGIFSIEFWSSLVAKPLESRCIELIFSLLKRLINSTHSDEVGQVGLCSSQLPLSVLRILEYSNLLGFFVQLRTYLAPHDFSKTTPPDILSVKVYDQQCIRLKLSETSVVNHKLSFGVGRLVDSFDNFYLKMFCT